MRYYVSDRVLNEYRDKSLEEIFGNMEEVSNPLGEFLKITDPLGSIDIHEIISKSELEIFGDIIKRKLYIVNGISSKKSAQLQRKNLNFVEELIGLSPKFVNVEELVRTIRNKDILNLKEIKGIYEEDLLFCVNPEEIIFLDIETTGQSASEVFLLGIGYLTKNSSDSKENMQKFSYKFTTELLFAREIAEEAAILKYFVDILPKFKMFVTYNGKQFDIPFICNRIGQLLELEDIIEPYKKILDQNKINAERNATEDNANEDENYENQEKKKDEHFPLVNEMMAEITSQFVHFDLFYAVKRTYKDVLRNFRLVTAEEELLDFYRHEHLPSGDVPQVYLDWLSNGNEYMGGLYKVLEHNFYDVLNMERLLKQWIITQLEENCSIIEKKLGKRLGIEENDTQKDRFSTNKKYRELKKYLTPSSNKKVAKIDDFFGKNN